MLFRKLKTSTIVFILLLTLSGLSFGFLVGRSQQARADQAKEQFHLVGEQVRASGAVVAKCVELVRHLLTH